jgi:Ni2+-binding GTPase involved in maturation of urease and hydrogenase
VKADARKLNKGIEIFPISAKTGDGFTSWYNWLKESVKNIRGELAFGEVSPRADN